MACFGLWSVSPRDTLTFSRFECLIIHSLFTRWYITCIDRARSRPFVVLCLLPRLAQVLLRLGFCCRQLVILSRFALSFLVSVNRVCCQPLDRCCLAISTTSGGAAEGAAGEAVEILAALNRARNVAGEGTYLEETWHGGKEKGRGPVKSVRAGVRVGRGLGIFHKFSQGVCVCARKCVCGFLISIDDAIRLTNETASIFCPAKNTTALS